jgi:hypothetical protein
VPRVDRAIWGRDRIERARRRWTLVRPPLPAVPHEDAPRTGRAAGEAAATRWCDTANAPGRGPIRGRDRIGRAPALRPLPTWGHTWSAPEGRAWGRLWGLRDACDVGALPPQCPGSGAHPGQRSYWGGRRPWGGPTTRAIPPVPQKAAPRMRISWEAGTGPANLVQRWHLHGRRTRFQRPGLCAYAGCPGS